MKSPKRPELSERTKIRVWAAAAGRCTLCNRFLLENEDLGLPVPIGELAHNVGWSATSPRGDSELDDDERSSPENLLLLCRDCHKPVDDGRTRELYTVEALRRRKQEHEARVRSLTEIGADRQAALLRVVGSIRGVAPELSYQTVLTAVTAAGLYPQPLRGANSAECDIDLRGLAGAGAPEHFLVCASQINERVAQIHDGIRRDEIKRLAVFGFARIPLLVHLGARLDDKVETIIFQRQRVDGADAWRWPDAPPAPPVFTTHLAHGDNAAGHVALVVNLSGTIGLDQLPPEIRDSHAIYVLEPVAPDHSHPTLISSPGALAAFDRAARDFLAMVERDHGKPDRVALFPAVPMSAAITLGRVLMPQLSPAWVVHDRDDEGHFVAMLEARR